MTHALQKSLYKTIKSRAEGKHAPDIFIDLSKAFDTLDHQTLVNLIAKLWYKGLSTVDF